MAPSLRELAAKQTEGVKHLLISSSAVALLTAAGAPARVPKNGTVKKSTYGNGNSESYTYNAYGELKRKTFSTTDNAISWRYDYMGRLIYERNNVIGQKTYYCYDDDGRYYGELVNSADSSNVFSNKLYSSYNSLDANGNVTKNSLTAGDKTYDTSYTYNDNGDVTATTISSSRAVNYGYNDFGYGNVLSSKTITTSTPITQLYGYSGEGELSSHRIGSDVYSYTFNGENLVVVQKNGTRTQNYSYDANNQLISERNLDTNQSVLYTYDNAGNIVSKEIRAYTLSDFDSATYIGTISYEYDSTWKDKLVKYDGQTITYDSMGNPLTYRDGMSFTWNGRQMATANLNGTAATYAYDSDGLRTKKTVGGVQYDYYYVDGQLRYEKKGSEYELYYRYDLDGNLVSVTRYNLTSSQSETYYAITNIFGDVIELRSDSGDVYAKYVYDSWGKLVSIKASNGIAEITDSSNIAIQNSIRYRGYVYDTESGLYYLQSRYYDPEIGRFLNADDIDLIGFNKSLLSYNAYAYCENNPINENDATGYSFETLLDVASIGWSVYELFKAPTWVNFGNLVWDIAATFIPFAPGSYVKKAGKVYLKIADKADDFKDIKSLTLGTYKGLKKLLKKIDDIEVHHIIEKRFSKLFDVGKNYFLSVPIHKDLHKTITKRWRNVCKYGTNYNNITKKQMKSYIRAVYYDMPKLRDQALKWLDQHWKGKL